MIIGGKKKKKASKKSTKSEAPKAKPARALTKAEAKKRISKVRDVADKINKALKGRGRILVGDEVKELEFEKERTGNPAIDYCLNGGLIRGAVSQLWGPEAASKTSTLAFIVRNFQARGLVCAVAPVEGFDKSWWRQIGTFIPYSKEEMRELEPVLRKKAERYNAHYEDRGWPPLVLIQHPAGDATLQMIYDMTKANVVDFIGLDSLGAVVSSRILEERDVDDEDERGGEARLFNRFQRFMQSAFNTYYDEDGAPTGDGRHKNRTIIAAINQARVTFGTRSNRREKQFHPTGGQGIKHFWSQSLFFDVVDEEAVQVNYDGMQRRDIVAKTFRVYGNKMRGGPPDRDARYVWHVKAHKVEDGRVWKSGQVDVVSTLRALGVMLKVITREGAYYTFDGERVQGKTKFDRFLWETPEAQTALYDAVIEAARKDSSAGSVPDVED